MKNLTHLALAMVLLGALTLITLTLAPRAEGGFACCSIVAIDVKTGLVTAWDSKLGSIFQFRMADSSPLRNVVLNPQQRKDLAKLGWPPPVPVIPPREDLIFRRGDKPPVAGSLRSLHAFATIATQSGEVRVSRDQIGMILVNGRLIPLGAPLLPLDEDAVMLVNGREVLRGRVEVDGEAVHVAGRTVQQSEVALIRLRDPEAAAQQPPIGAGSQEAGRPPSSSGTGGPGAAPSPVPGSPPPAARPRGPGEIPWGQAVWRGTLRFKMVKTVDVGGKIEPGDAATGSYYITWSEEPNVRSGTDVAQIRLRPVSLVYQYALAVAAAAHCKAFTVTKQGSGVGDVQPGFSSGGLLNLPFGAGKYVDSTHAGEYNLVIPSPTTIAASEIPKTCNLDNPPPSRPVVLRDLPSFFLSSNSVESPFASHAAIGRPDCTSSAPSFRAPPPYTTIAGEVSCGVPGQHDYRSFRWQFDRGVPPPDVTTQQDRCETARGLASLTRDQRQHAVDRLKQVGEEFAKTRQEEARLRATKDQLQGAFNLLLVAAAASDLGKKLLELAVSDGMLETAAATGEITAAQQEFIAQLNKFIESYKNWTELVDDPGEWGKSRLLGESQEDPASKEKQEHLIDGALEMFTLGQVLADEVSQGDGSAALDYIEDNLGALGPLVPDYAISKARLYVDVTRQWRDALKNLARLAAQGTNLAYQIAEADLGLKVRDRQLQDCLGQ